VYRIKNKNEIKNRIYYKNSMEEASSCLFTIQWCVSTSWHMFLFKAAICSLISNFVIKYYEPL